MGRLALLGTFAAVGVLLVVAAGAAWLGQSEAPPLPEPVELEGKHQGDRPAARRDPNPLQQTLVARSRARASSRSQDRRREDPREGARPAELKPAAGASGSSVTTVAPVATTDADASDDDADDAREDD
jgi:hypothetical protein